MAKKSPKTKKRSKAAQEKETLSFEEALQQLKEVVSELEAGSLTLSQSLEKYEQGVSSLKLCHEQLRTTQRQIELLVNLDEDGNLSTRTFDDTASYSDSQLRMDSDRDEEKGGDEEEGGDSLGDSWEDDPTLF